MSLDFAIVSSIHVSGVGFHSVSLSNMTIRLEWSISNTWISFDLHEIRQDFIWGYFVGSLLDVRQCLKVFVWII